MNDDTYTVWDDWDGLFEAMCKYVEDRRPGLMLSGESTFEESIGGRFQVSFELNGNGIDFSHRVEDYDLIMQMLEAGLDPEQIAEETGMPLEEIEELTDFDEE